MADSKYVFVDLSREKMPTFLRGLNRLTLYKYGPRYS